MITATFNYNTDRAAAIEAGIIPADAAPSLEQLIALIAQYNMAWISKHGIPTA
jgi:hypothetical protein